MLLLWYSNGTDNYNPSVVDSIVGLNKTHHKILIETSKHVSKLTVIN